MKKYRIEAVVLLVQLFMFYIFPLFAGPTDAMGMVFLILLATLLLSLVLGGVSGNKCKFLYPVIVSALFMPSIYIYYNKSALVHGAWYFVVATVGLLAGMVIRGLARKIFRKA